MSLDVSHNISIIIPLSLLHQVIENNVRMGIMMAENGKVSNDDVRETTELLMQCFIEANNQYLEDKCHQ